MRILVVDDHTVVREALCRLLDIEEDIEIVAQAGTGHEGITLAQELEPDVVVLDYGLPDMDGLEATRQIKATDVPSKVLILTMHGNEEYATRVLKEGASGFVVKAASTDELLVGIRKVAAGGVYVTPEIMEKMVARLGQPSDDSPESSLSNREMQVLLRLARGLSSREVSEDLHLSLSTIETYRGRVLEKLSLRNNSELTRFAIRRGLIDAD